MTDPIEVVTSMSLLGALDEILPYLDGLCFVSGALLILLGRYERRRVGGTATGAAAVVAAVCRAVRHPQLVGVLLIVLGLFVRSATLPLLLAWPVLVLLFVWVVRRRESAVSRSLDALHREQSPPPPPFRSRFR